MSNSKKSIQMKAVILNGGSKEIINETTGSKSHLFNAKIVDGPLAGKVVTAKRTVLNSEGTQKENCSKGQEVTLHYTTFVSKAGDRLPSFQISLDVTASNEDILSVMDRENVAQAGE